MTKRTGILIAIIAAAIVGTLLYAVATNVESGTVSLRNGEKVLTVKVADTFFERQRGLSGVEPGNIGADGTLFVFGSKAERTFWMKDMKFALDVVWIAGTRIVKIDENVPAPKAGEEPQKMYSTPFAVDRVLELPAGTVKANDIFIGTDVGIALDGKPVN